MNAHRTNIIHVIALMFISTYAYFDAMNKDVTQLLPLMLGVVLLSLNNGLLYGNKGQVRAAFVITIISILILWNMTLNARRHDDFTFMLYYSSMIVTGLVSLIFLAKSVFLNPK
jgi:hypothetical protein